MNIGNINKPKQETLHDKYDSIFFVLAIGMERAIFEEGEARKRILEYGSLVGEMRVIVFNQIKKGFLKSQNFGNVFLYPTNSKSRWFYIFDAVRLGKKILANGGQWLISCQDPFETGLAGYWLKRKFKIPWQLQIHTDFLSPYFWRQSFLNKIRVILAKFLLRRADGVRVVSERVKKSLGQLEAKVSILPIFVDVAAFGRAPITENLKQKYPQFDFIVLVVSRLEPEKNVGLAIKALAGVLPTRPRFGLLIVGEGNELKSLSVLAERLGVKKNVIFEPWRQDLASYYKSADLYLLTSNYEGYGRTVIEAMACSCPVLMTDVGIAGEIIHNNKNGRVAAIRDDKKIAEIMAEIAQNDAEPRRLAEKALETLKNFPDQVEYLNLYKKSWEECRR